MGREKVLITVKTYPTLSKKYGETVCTAGVRADGSWMRIYPVPFRRLEEEEQYKKFDWIETDFIRGRSDPRPETHHPADLAKMLPVGHIGTDDDWRERRELLLKKATVYDRLEPLLIGAKENRLSLAVFKPAKIRGFIWEDDDRDWKPDKVAQMREQTKQAQMFAEDSWRETFKLIPKLPYAFSYQIEDLDGRKSTMQVLDWECGQLYWNCLRRHDDESVALEKVKAKYLDEFGKRDLHFFLGTTQQFHGFAPNPWVAEFTAAGLRLKRAAVMLFGKDIRKWHPRCQVRILTYRGTEPRSGESYNVVKDDSVAECIIKLIDRAWERLTVALSQHTVVTDRARFEQSLLYPQIACREAMINAIVHRNYAIEGRGIEISVFQPRADSTHSLRR